MNRIAKILSRSVCAAALLLPCINAYAQAESSADEKATAAEAKSQAEARVKAAQTRTQSAEARQLAGTSPTPEEERINAKLRATRNRDYSLDPFKTFFLKSGTQPNDGNEILTGMRLMLDPSVKLYLLPSMNAIVVRGTQQDLDLAQKLLNDIDRPKRVYRLTYTITELDAGKRLGVQHFSLAVVSNGRTTLKNGSKVPVATGSYSSSGSPGQQTQFTYLDVGLNFDASVTEWAGGVTLRSKVEQSSATEEKLISGVQEPLIRQSVLEGTSILVPGVPSTLGSLDVAGSTRHLDVEVLLEVAK